MQRVLFLLQAHVETRRSLVEARCAAEPPSMIPNDWLHGGQQFRRGHDGRRGTGACEDRLDDVGVTVVRDDDAVRSSIQRMTDSRRIEFAHAGIARHSAANGGHHRGDFFRPDARVFAVEHQPVEAGSDQRVNSRAFGGVNHCTVSGSHP